MKKDYYVRRDLVNEQTNNEEEIYKEIRDKDQPQRSVVIESSYIAPESNNFKKKESIENIYPENFLG